MTESKKTRSPNFPAIDLKEAVSRVAELYNQYERTHGISWEEAADTWGISKNSSQLNQITAALRSYDLIRYAGPSSDRRMAVSNAAAAIVRRSEKRILLLKRALVKPDIFDELWTHFNISIDDVPNINKTVHYLMFDRSGSLFTQSSANLCAVNFHNSIEFVEMFIEQEFESDKNSVEQFPKANKSDKTIHNNDFVPIAIPIDGQMQIINIPRMDQQTYETFQNLLRSYESIIVIDKDSQKKGSS